MTRKIIFLLSVLLVSLSAEAESRIDKLLRNLHDKNSQYVFVIAHRGDWRNAPENSIQCIENAIAMGADMVELDIQQTKDNNFICMHDATLDRTSTGKGAIKNYTTTELKQFVLKSGNGIKTRRSIPTLEEALMTCKDRILVNIDKRYGTFPSASFAWRIINEPFFPKGTPLNDLKLRASWGKTGSMDGISNWAAMSLVTSGGNSYNGSSGFKIGADAADLIWEKANQVNVGINAELFNGRLALSVDGYYQKTSGLLYNISTLATTGYTTRTANIGSLENKGLEVMVSGKIFDGPFKWELATNLSYTKNKLLSLDGVLDMKINGGGANTGKVMHALMVGKPVSAFYMLRQDGIYQTDQEVPSKLYAKGVRAGDCKYFDYNNDGDITDDDRMYVGKVTPDIYGGITSTMNWKNFDLSIFCQFAAGGKILSAWKGCGGTEGTEHLGLASSSIKGYKNGTLVDSEQFYNISKYAANHYWRGEGTSNTVPRPTLAGTFTGGFGNNLVSTRYLEDASYFKFKTITLGYSLPHSLLSKIHVTGARIFVSLDNFFTLTKYSGYDPEFSYESNPTGNSYGADFGEQATLKSFIIGASINF